MATLHSRLIGSRGSPRPSASHALAGVFIGLSLVLLFIGLSQTAPEPLALALLGAFAGLVLNASERSWHSLDATPALPCMTVRRVN